MICERDRLNRCDRYIQRYIDIHLYNWFQLALLTFYMTATKAEMRAIRWSFPNTADNAEAPYYRSCTGKELHWKVTAGWIHTVSGNSISSAGKEKGVTVGMKQVSPCEGDWDLAALGSLSNALLGFIYELEIHKKNKYGGFTAIR